MVSAAVSLLNEGSKAELEFYRVEVGRFSRKSMLIQCLMSLGTDGDQLEEDFEHGDCDRDYYDNESLLIKLKEDALTDAMRNW